MRISDWSSDVCSSDLSGIILISLFGAESDCMEYELDDHTPRTCPDARLSQRIGGAKLCAAPAAGQRRPDRRKGISHPSRTGDGAPFLAERAGPARRSEKHTSEIQSLMRSSYAVFCLKKKIKHIYIKI